MAIVPFPRGLLRGLQWQQQGGRAPVQRSAFTGRARELDFGTAARWTAEGGVIPTRDRRLEWAGFEAASQVPGNEFRLRATEGSQYGAADNMIQNPELEAGSAPWLLESAWTRLPTGAPFDFPQFGLYTDSTRPANNAFANGGTGVPIQPSQSLLVSADVFRSSDSAGTLSLAVNFRNSGGATISTLGVNFLTALPAGVWQRAYGSLLAPVGTVSASIYLNNGLTAGFAAATGVRASLLPERVLVASGSAGRSLNLYSMIPDILHLRAGQLLTVPLPNGDEQLVRLTADLRASVLGAATAQLATPLRQVPAANANVELARPWGLMRATHTPGWGARPGGIYDHDFAAEEAF